MLSPEPLKLAILALVFCLAAPTASPAQTYTTLVNFSGNNGEFPTGGLVQDSEGNFYGATEIGGASTSCSVPNEPEVTTCGTIFEITASGTLETLHSFSGPDGAYPNGVVLDAEGKLYGTTFYGGANNVGTFFSLVPRGTLNTLYNFCSQTDCSDGSNPSGGLIQDSEGNFYGTTSDNAQPNACGGNCGTVFKVTSTGMLTTLYTFPASGTSTGYGPMSGVVLGNDGNFYGTTAYGGNDLCGLSSALYCGTIFKLTPTGTLTTLYDFCTESQCADGFSPGGLVQGTDANFYGPTGGGGDPGVCPTKFGAELDCGTLFKITPSGTFTSLHGFYNSDGQAPNQLIEASDGNFYGTTTSGGANATGTIFRMTPAGSLITLYSFGTAPAGIDPFSVLLQASGSFYGETINGGSGGDGTVFSFAIGMGGTSQSSNELSLSPSAVQVGSSGPVVMTATVTPTSGSGTPTGVVEFLNGSSEVGTADLSAGTATFDYNPSSLAINTYQITAMYSGDGTFAGSTSSPQTLTVNSLPPAATPSISPAGGTYSSAQTVTISDSTSGRHNLLHQRRYDPDDGICRLQRAAHCQFYGNNRSNRRGQRLQHQRRSNRDLYDWPQL